jgi:peptidoglycan/xylan/chitin deacetylase (PgdA/CDA1 family)
MLKKLRKIRKVGWVIIATVSLTLLMNQVQKDKVRATTNSPYIPVLMYHHFSNTYKNSITETQDAFLDQMTAIHKDGYTTITEEQLRDFYYHGKPLPKKPILITMDDGYKSNYDMAFPVLKCLNMKATYFTIIGQVGKTPGTIPHFSWQEAKEMEDSGLVQIESHTYDLHHLEQSGAFQKPAIVVQRKNETHAQYLSRITNDLQETRQIIKEKLNTDSIAIGYPYGKFNDEVVKVAEKVGFQLGYSIKEGVNTKDTNPQELNRITVNPNWSGKQMIKAIESYE